jgi:hypothetical protein
MLATRFAVSGKSDDEQLPGFRCQQMLVPRAASKSGGRPQGVVSVMGLETTHSWLTSTVVILTATDARPDRRPSTVERKARTQRG